VFDESIVRQQLPYLLAGRAFGYGKGHTCAAGTRLRNVIVDEKGPKTRSHGKQNGHHHAEKNNPKEDTYRAPS
jgi:hypothetical protein